jgi:hypothetical protein
MARRDARTVDAALARRKQYETTDPSASWRLTYREDGSFEAAAREWNDDDRGDRPRRFYGFGSTSMAARDVVSRWFVADGVPHIEVEKDWVGPSQVVHYGPETQGGNPWNDLTMLLSERGVCYQEHLAACVRTREDLLRHGVSGYLTSRIAHLNETEPQLSNDKLAIPTPRLRDAYAAFADCAYWVPSRLVVSTGVEPWNAFGDHRPETVAEIAEALASEVDLNDFTAQFFGGGPINLRCVPAWAGPVYQRGSNGTHRTHAARILRLPWLLATVDVQAQPYEYTLLHILSNDVENPAFWVDEENIEERITILRGLIKREVVDGELVVGDGDDPVYETTFRCWRLPAPWFLHNPSYAARVNQRYESLYPGAFAELGIPTQVATNSTEWVGWLSDS